MFVQGTLAFKKEGNIHENFYKRKICTKTDGRFG